MFNTNTRPSKRSVKAIPTMFRCSLVRRAIVAALSSLLALCRAAWLRWAICTLVMVGRTVSSTGQPGRMYRTDGCRRPLMGR